MKNYFKRLFQKDNPKYVFTTRNIARQTGNGERISVSGNYNQFWSVQDASQLVDVSHWTNSPGIQASSSTLPQTPIKPVDERKSVEPKAVFEEIKKENIEFSFENLDEKIKSVTERIEILKEHLGEDHLGDEHRALFYLTNRKKYLSTMKKYPLDWAVTNLDAIDDLCKRYKLRIVPLKQYYTLVPQEGIKEMKRYTEAYKAITGDMPIFELIIKEEEVKSEEEKKQKKKDRDPILVANSPLGNSLFVLGAWDDEVEFVDEIIYQGK